MNLLFLHPQFPGPFQHLAPALAADGANTVMALTLRTDLPAAWQGVQVRNYPLARRPGGDTHPWLAVAERQTVVAESVARAALQLRDEGFTPDVVCASSEWGDSLWIKTVWPGAKLGLVLGDFGDGRAPADPEFPAADPLDHARLLPLQALLRQAAAQADALWAPSAWLAHRWPEALQAQTTVVPEGLPTAALQPNPEIRLTLNGSQHLTRADEVVTFIADTLEPARGYHQFLRSLPTLLGLRPQAQVLIVGGHEAGVGLPPPAGTSWREHFAAELRPQLADADWSRIHFLGAQPAETQRALLQLASVHVALGAGLPLERRVLEAMALGCPVVAADAPALREAITDGETGRLVDPADAETLGQAVAELLADPAYRETLATQTRARVQAQHDLHAVALPRQLDWVQALATPAPTAPVEEVTPEPVPPPPAMVEVALVREALIEVQELLRGEEMPGAGAEGATPVNALVAASAG